MFRVLRLDKLQTGRRTLPEVSAVVLERSNCILGRCTKIRGVMQCIQIAAVVLIARIILEKIVIQNNDNAGVRGFRACGLRVTGSTNN